MEGNLYVHDEGEVILFMSQMCDEFEKYICANFTKLPDGQRMNWLFNVFVNRKLKKFKVWHKHVVNTVRFGAWSEDYNGKKQMVCGAGINFINQPDVCNIEARYAYES